MKIKSTLALFFIIATYIIINAWSGGYGSGGNQTGSTGSTGCSCHGANANLAVTVSLDSMGVPVTSYRPGGSYTVRIKGVNNSAGTYPEYGFQISTVKAASAGTASAVNIGTWGAMPANTQVTANGSIQLAEQSAPNLAFSGSGGNGTIYQMSIPWTAPAAGTGSIKIYGIVNAVNGNGNIQGDGANNAPAVTITEAAATVPASVSIAITSGTNPTCFGSSVTFTATPTNGGTAPTYQWKVNGGNVGGNSPTFTTNTLTNGQIVTCVMTSSLTNASNNPATSNSITMSITSPVTPSVAIALTSGTNPACAGSSVTFTATPTNGGTAPRYQWKVNGTNVGGNSATYTTNTLTNGQIVTCVMTSSQSCVTSSTATSNAITMSITTNVTPTVSIAANTTNFCAGTSVTFTATPTNGGTAPSYQWKVNGANVGGNSSTYTTTALTNGQIVSCVMTSNLTCVTSATATSNSITVTVNPLVTPAVSITTPTTSICAGASVTFTATPTNGGTPSYQWKVNGSNVGGNSATFTSTTLANNDIVTCVMISTANCASPTTATSNSITMQVNTMSAPAIAIVANKTSICSGDSVIFTATPTNGGTAPSYQWKVNGTNVGGNSATFATNTLTNGQTVTCVLTSNSACATNTTATSNTITMSVTTRVTPTVLIAANTTNFCAGTSVTFTATPTNGGTTPSYQWKVNGANVGGNSSTYTTTALTNGQIVSCVMTSNITCVTSATATSNSITVTVNPLVTPAVSITAPTNIICAGASVTFTATPTNGGTPSYQWKVNSGNVGGNSATFTSSTLTNNDIVTCVMTSTANCASPTTATSNAITMQVSGISPSTIAISSDKTNACDNDTVHFTASITNGGSVLIYQWMINGVTVGGNSNTFSSTALNNGDTVKCQLTSNSACSISPVVVSNPIVLTITPNVTPSITINSAAAFVCKGRTITYQANGVNGGTAPVYQWRVNGSNVGTNSNSYTAYFNNGDVVNCTLISNANCASPASVVSTNAIASVKDTPTPVITVSNWVNQVATLTSSANGVSYVWFMNGNAITQSTNPITATPADEGSYVVLVVDSNGCQGRSSAAQVVWTKISEPSALISAKVYPNPVTEYINISLSLKQPANNIQVRLIDHLGRVFLEKNISEKSLEINEKINSSHLAKGIYTLLISSEKETINYAIVKE